MMLLCLCSLYNLESGKSEGSLHWALSLLAIFSTTSSDFRFFLLKELLNLKQEPENQRPTSSKWGHAEAQWCVGWRVEGLAHRVTCGPAWVYRLNQAVSQKHQIISMGETIRGCTLLVRESRYCCGVLLYAYYISTQVPQLVSWAPDCED